MNAFLAMDGCVSGSGCHLTWMIEHWFRLPAVNTSPRRRSAQLPGRFLVYVAITSNVAPLGCTTDEYSRRSSEVQTTVEEGGATSVTVTGVEVASGGAIGRTSANGGAQGSELLLAQGGVRAVETTSAILASSAGATSSAGMSPSAGAGSSALLTGGTSSTGGAAGSLMAVRVTARTVVDKLTFGIAGASSFLTLRDAAAARQLWIGAALNGNVNSDKVYASLAASEFDYLTPENEMKWTSTEPLPNTFNFVGGDQLVAFAQMHKMRVKGHTLVWHAQLPDWVESLSTADEVRQALTNHIQNVVGHYKGKVAAWDVVNEAIDNTLGNPLRASVFQQRLGSTYIDEAFRLAHEVDPTALLFYNDYGIEGMSSKADAAYELVKRLKTSGVPIHGVGLQMHIGGTGSPTAAEVIANMRRIAGLGLLVNISEMDVNLCSTPGDQATKFAVQGQRYREIVAACVAEPMCHAVTLWGITDKYSWLNSAFPCTNSADSSSPWALPWDSDYARKPAWEGIMSALLGN